MTVGQDPVTGRPVRKSFYSEISKEDAAAKGREYLVEKEVAERTAGFFVGEEIRFADWAKEWLRRYKKGKVKANTYTGTYYDPVHNHLIPYFGEMFLTDIRPVHVQAFYDSKRNTHALESIRKMRNSLRAIFDTAIENDLCYRNPARSKGLVLKSDVRPPEKRAYTAEQYKTVWEFAEGHPEGLAILVLLETGMSRSELLGLRWEDLDPEQHILNIRQGTVDIRDAETRKYTVLSEGLKNSYRQRPIPLSEKLWDRLAANPRIIETTWRAKRGDSARQVKTEFIFHSNTGGVFSPKNWTNRMYLPFMREMHAAHPEVPILNPHELRHTRATLWKNDRVDLFSMAKLLGHSDLDMLAKRYAHNDINALKDALGLLEQEA